MTKSIFVKKGIASLAVMALGVTSVHCVTPKEAATASSPASAPTDPAEVGPAPQSAERGKGTVEKGVVVELQKESDTSPLSRFESLPSESQLAPFLARDPRLAQKVTLSPLEAASRETALRSKEVALRPLPPKDPRALELGREIFSLHVMQTLYLERLLAFRKSDSAYPDPVHFAKAAHGMVVVAARRLMKNFPAHAEMKEWEAASLISRIRIGEAAAFEEAKSFVEKNRKTGAATRVHLVLAGAVHLGRVPALKPFDDLAAAMELPMDSVSKAVVSLMVAEAESEKRNWDKARGFFLDCVKYGRLPHEAQGGPLFARCAGRLVEVSLEASPRLLDPRLVELLLHFNDYERARFYAESVALNDRDAQPEATQKIYDGLVLYSRIPLVQLVKLAVRTLDLAVRAKDVAVAERRWHEVINLLKTSESTALGLEERWESSHNMFKLACEAPGGEKHVAGFVRVHDLLGKSFEGYGKDDSREISLLTSLDRVKAHKTATERADVFKAEARTSEGRLRARRFAYDVRRKMLALPETPDWKPGRKLSGDPDLARTFVEAGLDYAKEGAAGSETERVRHNVAYVAALSGQSLRAAEIFEETLRRFSKEKLASDGSSFFLHAFADEPVALEKTLRVVVETRVVPAASEHKSPRVMLEDAVWARAERHEKGKEFESAGISFAAFQNEFPTHKNAATALRRAAQAALQAGKRDKALGNLELLVETYPRHALALEARWEAAELAGQEEQELRAAGHLAMFAQSYGREGLARRAWLKAAALFEKAGSFEKAIPCYEAYVAQDPSPQQQFEALRALGQLQRSKGLGDEAIKTFRRIGDLAPRLEGESSQETLLWANVQILEVHAEAGRRGEVEALGRRIVSTKAGTQAGLASVARAHFLLGLFGGEGISKSLAEPNFVIEHDAIMDSYARARASLLAACEVPGSLWCSAAYLEASQLAGKISMAFQGALPPVSTEGADPLRDAVLAHLALLKNETGVYAHKAKDALERNGASNDFYRMSIEKIEVK